MELNVLTGTVDQSLRAEGKREDDFLLGCRFLAACWDFADVIV
jgi:hypothetical protein